MKSFRRPSLPPRRRERRSSVLIVTLFFVTLMTILLLGFLGSMRLETFSARSHYDGVMADVYVQAATDMALTRLYAATSDTNRFWVTQPGLLYASPSGTNYPLSTAVDLSSGVDTASSPSVDEAVNLNPPLLANPALSLIATTNAAMPNTAMRVHWIYQHQDGTLDTNNPTAMANKSANPLIGRYAFWCDDESAKINLNTAWTRGTENTNSILAHPSRVHLGAISTLASTDPDAISSFRTLTNYYDSVESARQAGTATAATFADDAFSVTHVNHAPELNMFGEPRILLTTQKSVADAMGTTNFIDVLTAANTDPGTIASLSSTKVGTVVQKIASELNRTNWPMLPGASFATKYSGSIDTTQIAMNIVDYVRSAESTNSIVEPLRGNVAGTTFTLSTTGTRMSVSRHPFVSEFGVFINGQPTKNHGTGYSLNYTPILVITLPINYGLASVDLSQIYVTGHLYMSLGNPDAGAAIAWPPLATISAAECSSHTTTLLAGHSVTVTLPSTTGITYEYATRPTLIDMQPVLEMYPSTRTLDAVALSEGGVNMPIDPVTTTIQTMRSVSVDDPCVGARASDWHTNAANDFTSPTQYTPGATIGKPATKTPQQDADANGNLTDISIHMPPPKGQTQGNFSNPLGLVSSIGDLGFIHTGTDGAGTSTAAGVPWRTLRLQPSVLSSGTLPDWAILDLFEAPVPATAADAPFLIPGNSTNSFVNVGGKVNVNAAIQPFPNLSRLEPLEALVLNASIDGTNKVQTTGMSNLAQNIANLTMVKPNPYPNTNILYSPGQLADIKGISDGGEATEAMMREISSLATTRGNVFSIYAVGQALKQDTFGNIHVEAERRTRRIFERVMSGGTVIFQPVYSQDLR